MTSSSRSEIQSLTGLRFFAAISILQNHLLLGFVSRSNPYFATMLNACGVLGMNIFFVLSGFIIHYTYSSRLSGFSLRAIYDFAVARISRLYPLFVMLLLLEIATSNTVLHLSIPDFLYPLPFFATLTQSWFYHLLSNGTSVVYAYPRATIDWSISTEMLMYAFYPVILFFLVRDRTTGPMRNVCVSVLVLIVSIGLAWANAHLTDIDGLVVRFLGARAGLDASGGYSATVWLAFLSPYIRIFEFLVGVLTAHCFLLWKSNENRSRDQRIPLGLAITALILIAGSFLPPSVGIPWFTAVRTEIGYCPLIALVIYCCSRCSNSIVERFFSLRLFVVLGECSYSIYLFHIFIYSAIQHGPSAGWITALRIAVAWIAIFSSALVLYPYIELPLRRWMRGKLTIGGAPVI